MTQQLVEAFDQQEVLTPPVEVIEEERSPEVVPEQDSDCCAALRAYTPFLKGIADGSPSLQRTAAQKRGCLPDALVEEINTIAFDLMGDILIETNEDGTYTIIEDYYPDVEPLLLEANATSQKGDPHV